MICWVTDNRISQIVMEAVSSQGHAVRHIKDFDSTPLQPSIFYGIMRGTGRSMHILKHAKVPFIYLDNGYFDANYVNRDWLKDMGGTFRIVHNDMVEHYKGPKSVTMEVRSGRCLVIPPTIYTANHYDTTPEDWLNSLASITSLGFEMVIRDKRSEIPLDDDIKRSSMVIAFNSRTVIRALELGVPAFDTHGILRNVQDEKFPSVDDLKAYYLPKQATLQEIAGMKWM